MRTPNFMTNLVLKKLILSIVSSMAIVSSGFAFDAATIEQSKEFCIAISVSNLEICALMEGAVRCLGRQLGEFSPNVKEANPSVGRREFRLCT